jgi:hypothetical protein
MTNSMPRRRILRMMAAAAMGNVAAHVSLVLAKGDKPVAPSIYQLDGTATVNGREARAGTPVAVGDRIATGPRSQAVVVLGGDAFLLRSDTSLEVKGKEGTLSELSVATGKVLSVFAKKPVAIKAATASIGIRGTGGYLEVDAATVYFCLCYGEARIEAPGTKPLDLQTQHHESPLLMHFTGQSIRIEPGPFRDHKDAELVMLEALVGRQPPFLGKAEYPSGRY